jgi:cell division protein FtsL
MRLLHLIVIVALVVAAAYVYRIKFEATVQAERVAKLRVDIRHERDQIANLRADWARLDNPARIERLAKRHLPLKPVEATQLDGFERLPERPPEVTPPDSGDPIGAMIENLEDTDLTTGAIATPPTATDKPGSAPDDDDDR